ncbi:MAG: hypothetical protein IPJ73_21975 [Zoogloea sp.]|nr:hypothetical protein [Zoogloea sp.]
MESDFATVSKDGETVVPIDNVFPEAAPRSRTSLEATLRTERMTVWPDDEKNACRRPQSPSPRAKR